MTLSILISPDELRSLLPVDRVQRYLKAHGWEQQAFKAGWIWYHPDHASASISLPEGVWPTDFARRIEEVLPTLAKAERRSSVVILAEVSGQPDTVRALVTRGLPEPRLASASPTPHSDPLAASGDPAAALAMRIVPSVLAALASSLPKILAALPWLARAALRKAWPILLRLVPALVAFACRLALSYLASMSVADLVLLLANHRQAAGGDNEIELEPA